MNNQFKVLTANASKALLVSLALGILLISSTPPASAQPATVNKSAKASMHPDESTTQLIIKFKSDHVAAKSGALTKTLSTELSEAAGVPLTYFRDMASGAKVMKLPSVMSVADVERITKKLSANPLIEYAEPDYRMFPMLVPNDPGYPAQWHLNEILGGVNAPAAWDITTGLADTVVAVLDSGITQHPDLDARILPGYDFVTDIARANDSDVRDADPSDPGDWINAADKQITQFADCQIRNSSWHGTMVAGAIGAIANNGTRGVGLNWQAKILPVRVLGKCGGMASDIADGMLWAAGFPVNGVPLNETPAKILNLSLGGRGACPNSYQQAIDSITATGRIVVVSAGNDNNADVYRPASCVGVINVAATNRSGSKASYSNFGSRITIAAPGGESDFFTTGNTGTTTIGQATTVGTSGTSFSAPTVSGVISLMVALRPDLDSRTVTDILKITARPFPDGSCNTSICGAGIVDAAAALRLTRDLSFALPSAVGFGDTDANKPNADLLFNIYNYGSNNASTVNATISAGQSDYSIVGNSCTSALTVGTSCSLALRFNPSGSGLRSGTLLVTLGGNLTIVPLAGYGYATGEFVQKSSGLTSNPTYITRASDGAFWFTENANDTVSRIAVDGTTKEWTFPTANSGPFDIVEGADGNIWVTQIDANRIARITPAGVITEFELPTATSSPRGIAKGPDGNIWFTQLTGARVGKITPTGTITEFTIPWSPSSPRGIATGPDGNLWFTDSVARAIARVTPAGEFTRFNLPWASDNLRSIVAGPDGNMWFTESVGNRVGRITMSGVATEFAMARPGTSPLGIMRGADNAIWYAGFGASLIGRIDVSNGNVTEYRLPVPGSFPTGMVQGPDGGVWIAAAGRNSVVTLALAGTRTQLASNAKRTIMDADGDGRSELVLREGSSRLSSGRLVNDTFQFAPHADPGGNFRLVGVGDFNGNGKSDLAFQNMTQAGEFGDVRAWTDFDASNEMFWRQVKKVWDVQVVGDMDGDGKSDLVWRYVVSESPDTGVSYIWFSSGSGVSQVRKRGGAPLNWTLLGAADLDQTGGADMVYISPEGNIRILMATPDRTCANVSGGTMPTDFTALKIADFTGRSRGDMLVRNATTGAVQLLALNAAGMVLPPYTGNPNNQDAACTPSSLSVTRSTITLPTTDPSWQFYASGDFNGDGVTDIVWRRPDNTLTVWLMNANGASPRAINNAGSVPANTTPVALQ
jgi:serine protease